MAQTSQSRWPVRGVATFDEWRSRRKGGMLPAVACMLLPLSPILAQDSASDRSAESDAQPARTAGVVAEVDETVRFGVSLTDLHARTHGAVVEVLWGSGDLGMDDLRTLGFSMRDHVPSLLATIVPEAIIRADGSQPIVVKVRHDGELHAARLLLVDRDTGAGVVEVVAEPEDGETSPAPSDDEVSGEGADPSEVEASLDAAPTFEPGHRLAFDRGRATAGGAVVFGFDSDGHGVAHRCVAGRIAGRDSRYLGEPLPTSLWRVHMHFGTGVAGTPLFDESGQVFGLLTTRMLESPEVHHAVPIEVMIRVLRDLGAQRATGVAWIGATFHLDSSTPQIVAVRPGSPAEEAGLRGDDVVISIAGTGVTTLDELADAFYYLSAGEESEIVVLRGLEKLSFRLVPALAGNRDLDGDGIDDTGFSADGVRRPPAEPLGSPSAAVRLR